MARKIERKLAVFDAETDPFLHGRTPKPFCFGFFDGENFRVFWGADCVEKLLAFLAEQPPLILYAHNGGKFDFFFLLQYLGNPVRVINGRIVEARLGRHILRDSYAILPIPLAAFAKDEIDYSRFESDVRDLHRAEIVNYLRTDCVKLFELVKGFRDRFDDHLTIGGCALKKLRELHPVESLNANHDAKYRPFYFGGRVQCFQRGILPGPWQVFDVNSMYPHVMSGVNHPCGAAYSTFGGKDFFRFVIGRSRPYFIEFEGLSLGAVPWRDLDTGKLEFPREENRYVCTSHEFEAGVQLGLISRVKVIAAHVCESTVRFDKYVMQYMADKIRAKEAGDKAAEIFAKLLLNSAYGKFGQNPENYRDYFIRRAGEDMPEGDEWRVHTDAESVQIYERDSQRHIYHDVAIAASITGASRAMLLRALHSAQDVIYCDTDSVICRGPGNLEINPTKLGAWKREASAAEAVIIGRKLYGLFNGDDCVKMATKGFSLGNPKKLFDCWRGAEILFENPAPNFKLDGTARFTSRRILREYLD